MEDKDFTSILGEMNKMGWQSLIWQSKMTFLNLAGIKEIDKNMLSWLSSFRINFENVFSYRADIFFRGEDLFYITQKVIGMGLKIHILLK
jgi:hypothetical protein